MRHEARHTQVAPGVPQGTPGAVLASQIRRINPASDYLFDLQADGLAEVKGAEEQ